MFQQGYVTPKKFQRWLREPYYRMAGKCSSFLAIERLSESERQFSSGYS